MKYLLILLALLALSACTGKIQPVKTFSIPLSEIPAMGAGRIRPVAMEGGHVKAERIGFNPSSSMGTSRWILDLGEWSRYFAEYLREKYSRRGVDVNSGPGITVEVIDFKMVGERVSWTKSKVRKRLIADVHIGNRTWTFNANTENPTNSPYTYDLVRLILQNEEIQAIARGRE